MRFSEIRRATFALVGLMAIAWADSSAALVVYVDDYANETLPTSPELDSIGIGSGIDVPDPEQVLTPLVAGPTGFEVSHPSSAAGGTSEFQIPGMLDAVEAGPVRIRFSFSELSYQVASNSAAFPLFVGFGDGSPSGRGIASLLITPNVIALSAFNFESEQNALVSADDLIGSFDVNIVVSSFCDAYFDVTGIQLPPSVPCDDILLFGTEFGTDTVEIGTAPVPLVLTAGQEPDFAVSLLAAPNSAMDVVLESVEVEYLPEPGSEGILIGALAIVAAHLRRRC